MIRAALSIVYRKLPKRLVWRAIWLKSPKFNVGVAGVLFDEAGRVLLVEHVFRRTYPWGLPSGWIEPSETAAQALVREVREETGLACEVAGLIAFESGFQSRCTAVLIGRSGGTPDAASIETHSAAFFEPHELPEGLLPASRVYIERAVAVRQSGLEKAGGPWLDGPLGDPRA